MFCEGLIIYSSIAFIYSSTLESTFQNSLHPSILKPLKFIQNHSYFIQLFFIVQVALITFHYPSNLLLFSTDSPCTKRKLNTRWNKICVLYKTLFPVGVEFLDTSICRLLICKWHVCRQGLFHSFNIPLHLTSLSFSRSTHR